MTSLNKVTLIGNLGRDPEIRTFQNGGRVASFSIATTEFWKDKGGEVQERTEWHNIVIYAEGLIKVAEKHLKKGDSVYIEGKLQTRTYEKDEQTKYVAEIVLQPYGGVLKTLTKKAGEAKGDSSPMEPEELEDEFAVA